MAKKKKKSNKLEHKLHPLEIEFNEIGKDFNEFKVEQLKQYTSDGQSIDKSAFEGHFKMIFLFGHISLLRKEVLELRNEIAELKGDKNVGKTKEKTGTRNSRTTNKKSGSKSSNQLQLGL